jgi:hypothetical protein
VCILYLRVEIYAGISSLHLCPYVIQSVPKNPLFVSVVPINALLMSVVPLSTHIHVVCVCVRERECVCVCVYYASRAGKSHAMPRSACVLVRSLERARSAPPTCLLSISFLKVDLFLHIRCLLQGWRLCGRCESTLRTGGWPAALPWLRSALVKPRCGVCVWCEAR